jgi:hypothetical protein
MARLPELILPTKLSKRELVELTVERLDVGLPRMTSEWGREQVRISLRRAIRDGTLSLIQVIKAADTGFSEADRALREEWIEREEDHEPVPDLLRDYMKRRAAAEFAPKPRPRGNELLDDFARNLAICALVHIVREYWHQTRRMAFVVVSEALGRRQINLSPRRVENIFNDLGGLAARIARFIPSEV